MTKWAISSIRPSHCLYFRGTKMEVAKYHPQQQRHARTTRRAPFTEAAPFHLLLSTRSPDRTSTRAPIHPSINADVTESTDRPPSPCEEKKLGFPLPSCFFCPLTSLFFYLLLLRLLRSSTKTEEVSDAAVTCYEPATHRTPSYTVKRLTQCGASPPREHGVPVKHQHKKKTTLGRVQPT